MTELDMIPRKDIKKLLIAFAMTAAIFSAAQAFGADNITPRSQVTLTADNLTVSDVFDGVTHDGDHVLAPAPAFGKMMTLGDDDLMRISDAFNLGWDPEGKTHRVVIRRDLHEIDHNIVETALQKALSGALQGKKFDVRVNGDVAGLHVPTGVSSDIDVSNLKYDLSKGEFHATLTAAGEDGHDDFKKDVDGHIFPITSVPVLARAISQGDVIASEDIQYIDVRSEDLTASMIVDPDKLIGESPRRSIAALKPVMASDVIMPVLIKKGEAVTMRLQNHSIQLTALGKALESGSNGDVVRVMNTGSQQVVQAIVTGPQMVEVKSPADEMVN